jgi:hypothetical protein
VFATPPALRWGAAPMGRFADLPRAPKLERPRRVRRSETSLERSLSCFLDIFDGLIHTICFMNPTSLLLVKVLWYLTQNSLCI